MIDRDTKLDYSKCGPAVPLNAAAIAEQERHAAAVDPLLETCDKAQREYIRARQAMVDAELAIQTETQEWARTMRRAMPELADVEEFWISADGKHYHLPPPVLSPDNTRGRSPIPPPEWVQQIIASGEG